MIEAPSIKRRDQRRETILRVAAEVFFEEGYSAASMSEIAARLGGSKGTLYNYFKSKEELFSAHIQTQCQHFAEETFTTALKDDQPIEAALTKLGLLYSEHIYSRWAVSNFRLMVTEAKRAPELASIFYEAGPAKGKERLTAYLERAKQRGLVNPPDCRRAAGEFISLCRGDEHFKVVLNLSDAPIGEQKHDDIASAVAMFMAAYGVKPSV